MNDELARLASEALAERIRQIRERLRVGSTPSVLPTPVSNAPPPARHWSETSREEDE